MKNKKVIYLLILFAVLIAHTVLLSFWLSSERTIPTRVRVDESKHPSLNARILLPISDLMIDSAINSSKFNNRSRKEIR
nr:hypothetical protein [Pseudopedobacter sp.]